MEYQNYERKIVEKHGIVIAGWTYESFTSPSNFKRVADIKILFDAVRAGTCKATKLSEDEWIARKLSNKMREEAGEDVYGDAESKGKPGNRTSTDNADDNPAHARLFTSAASESIFREDGVMPNAPLGDSYIILLNQPER